MKLWPKKAPKTAPEPRTEPGAGEDAPLTTRELVGQLLLTCTDLRGQVERQASEMATLRLEWSDTLDRIQRWASRQGARHQRDIAAALAEVPAATPSPQQETKAELRRRVFTNHASE